MAFKRIFMDNLGITYVSIFKFSLYLLRWNFLSMISQIYSKTPSPYNGRRVRDRLPQRISYLGTVDF